MITNVVRTRTKIDEGRIRGWQYDAAFEANGRHYVGRQYYDGQVTITADGQKMTDTDWELIESVIGDNVDLGMFISGDKPWLDAKGLACEAQRPA